MPSPSWLGVPIDAPAIHANRPRTGADHAARRNIAQGVNPSTRATRRLPFEAFDGARASTIQRAQSNSCHHAFYATRRTRADSDRRRKDRSARFGAVALVCLTCTPKHLENMDNPTRDDECSMVRAADGCVSGARMASHRTVARHGEGELSLRRGAEWAVHADRGVSASPLS